MGFLHVLLLKIFQSGSEQLLIAFAWLYAKGFKCATNAVTQDVEHSAMGDTPTPFHATNLTHAECVSIEVCFNFSNSFIHFNILFIRSTHFSRRSPTFIASAFLII